MTQLVLEFHSVKYWPCSWEVGAASSSSRTRQCPPWTVASQTLTAKIVVINDYKQS